MPAEKDVDRIVQDRFFRGRTGGVLVEVGAARPDYLSISASFRALGWQVIAIEPNPGFCAEHRALGHEVLEYACSDEDKDNVEFFVVNSQGADYLGGKVSFESYSSLGIKDEFKSMLARQQTSMERIEVKMRRLDTILAAHYPELEQIDVLAIDVEGWELSVLGGLDLERYRPRVVILENYFKSKAYVDYMKQHGYRRWKRLDPNEIYIRGRRYFF